MLLERAMIIKLSSEEVTTAIAQYAHEKLGLSGPREYSVSVQISIRGNVGAIVSAEVAVVPPPVKP